MANLAKFLKYEISRLSRKSVRAEFGNTKKQVAQYRREIAGLKRQLADQQRRIVTLERRAGGSAAAAAAAAAGVPADSGDAGSSSRFSPKWLRSHRQKLGISAADYAKLVGVSGLTIYNWEHEKVRPRASQVAKLAAIRGMGVREVRRRLDSLASEG